MTIVEAPVAPVAPEIRELTPVQEALLDIRRKVEDGDWCRNRLFDCTAGGSHCMLGHIVYNWSLQRDSLIKALTDVVTPEEIDELIPFRGPYPTFSGHLHPTGGFVYRDLTTSDSGLLTSYNNTRESREDIIDWIDRALLAL